MKPNLHNIPLNPYWRDILLPQRGEERRGFLVEASPATGIPFPIARAYWIHHWGGHQQRGGHAHRHVQQVFCCLQGKVKMQLRYGDWKNAIYTLDRPHVGLWTAPLVWMDMTPLTRDTILLVLASSPHDEREYIRSPEEYGALMRPLAAEALPEAAPVGAR